MRVLPYGDRALLVEVDGAPVIARAALVALGGVDEVVPAAQTVLVRFHPSETTAAALAEAIDAALIRVRGNAPESGEDVTDAAVILPVHYDGADLPSIAEQVGCSVEEVIRRHLAGKYEVAFCGFSPGFAYLTGLDPRLHLPRLSEPRTSVPAGAVGIAGQYTAAYPRSSPGGWQLLGRTDAPLWDADRRDPALLRPGARVRFERVR